MSVLEVEVNDLAGLIDLGTRLYKPVPKSVIRDPHGERRRWRAWGKSINKALEKRPVETRPVPRCHELGAKPQGYDWSKANECASCAVKASCVLAGPGADRVVFQISADASQEAVHRWSVNRPNIQKSEPGLTRRNPAGNWNTTAIWGIYPSGMIIPRVFPKMRAQGNARLYQIEVHRHDDVPVLYVTGVYRADSALEMLDVSSYLELELALERKWTLWKRVDRDVDRVISSSAIGAVGSSQHIQIHVRYDLDIEAGDLGKLQTRRVSGWDFWHMDTWKSYRQERHAEAKRIRREGRVSASSIRSHTRCGACARLRVETAR